MSHAPSCEFGTVVAFLVHVYWIAGMRWKVGQNEVVHRARQDRHPKFVANIFGCCVSQHVVQFHECLNFGCSELCIVSRIHVVDVRSRSIQACRSCVHFGRHGHTRCVHVQCVSDVCIFLFFQRSFILDVAVFVGTCSWTEEVV